MFLSAEQGHHHVNLTDGNGDVINNCIEIDTATGRALVFMDWDKPDTWPEHWKFGQFLGWGGAMKVEAQFKPPITVTTRSGVIVEDELQLAVTGMFDNLGRHLELKAKRNKSLIDSAFTGLWAELAAVKAGIFKKPLPRVRIGLDY